MRRREIVLAASLPGLVWAQPKKKKIDKGPPLEGPLVKEFVGAAHADLDKTKAMLADKPFLIRSTWDWGGGDFETALGGAAHMGRHDIAEFLIASGAPMDIFAAAMLGRLEIVRAACEAFPNTVHVLGPHKIPLVEHARKGGPRAEAVLRYLEEQRGSFKPA
jgi:hypothetical protein